MTRPNHPTQRSHESQQRGEMALLTALLLDLGQESGAHRCRSSSNSGGPYEASLMGFYLARL